MNIFIIALLLSILSISASAAIIWRLVKAIHKLNDHDVRIHNIYTKFDYVNENIDGLNHKSVENEEKMLLILSDIREALKRVETSLDNSR